MEILHTLPQGPEQKSDWNELGFEELDLKNKSEKELVEGLLESNPEWTDQERYDINCAYNLAATLHADDKHKELPYIFHPLRVANRAARYLGIKDANTITAALLHDVVEDHPTEILPALLAQTGIEAPITNPFVPEDPFEQQAMGFMALSHRFGIPPAEQVEGVTNAPPITRERMSPEQKMAAYREKVIKAIEPIEGWIIKFCDWCDNGLGVNHGDLADGSPEKERYRRKYGMILEILENRFLQKDIQDLLSDEAKAYVISRFALGRERLIV